MSNANYESDTCADALKIWHTNIAVPPIRNHAGSKAELDNLQQIDPDEFDMLVNVNKELEVSSNHYKDAANQWRDESFKHYENYEIAQMTITSLRAVITELSEALQAADANARICITSSELLELIYGNEDTADTPF